MSNPAHGVREEEDDDQGEVYIDEADIINEVDVDEEGASQLLYLSDWLCILCLWVGFMTFVKSSIMFCWLQIFLM